MDEEPIKPLGNIGIPGERLNPEQPGKTYTMMAHSVNGEMLVVLVAEETEGQDEAEADLLAELHVRPGTLGRVLDALGEYGEVLQRFPEFAARLDSLESTMGLEEGLDGA